MLHKTIFQRLLVFLFVVLVVNGCVGDDFSKYQKDLSTQEVNDYRFNIISFSDLKKKNTRVLQKIEEVSYLKNKALGRNYRMDYNEQFGVFIDTTQVVMLSNENDHTITFRIVSEDENDKEVENLVLRSKQNGAYSAYVTKYEISDNDLQDISLVSLTPIDNNYQTNMLGNVSDCIDTRTITRSFCRDKEGNVFGYDDKGEVDPKCHGMPYSETYMIIYIDLKCMGGGAGSGAYTGGGGYDNGGYDYGSGFDFGGSYGGGAGGGGNTSNPGTGNGNTNPENPVDGSLNDYGVFNPFPTTPVLGQLTPPQQEPIDHIAELEKITDQDADTPFRAKIDEYVGMLDTAEVEVGVVYVKNADGSYNEIHPATTYFDRINFSDVLVPVNRMELGIHLHHNQSNSKGQTLTHAPSTGDVIGFCDSFSLRYTNSTSNREIWTDIIVTANGLYALRGFEPQKVRAFANAFSNPTMFEKIMEIFNKKYNEEVLKYASDELKNNCNNGCTPEQIKQMRNLATNQGFINFINHINKTYKVGIGVFKGTLNAGTENYDWQQISQ